MNSQKNLCIGDAPSIFSYRIGLTGNIATGKSTVGRMLEQLGATRIDADKVAHQVLLPEGAAYEGVIARFGKDIVMPEGQIDRQKLGAIVFADPEALRDLENLVHPPVIALIAEMTAAAPTRVVVVEAIKLLETGMADCYEAIWVTNCPEGMQLDRLVKIRKIPTEVALQRLRAQPSQKLKIARADVVIDTSGSLEATRAQVQQAWQAIPGILPWE